jgi:beta-lactamase regulating signal transducer with metallopeptidase domain
MNPDQQLLLLLDLLLKGAMVLALAFLASWLWRVASAANRHLIWLAAFAVLLLAPLAGLLSPLWSWSPGRAKTTAFATPAVTQRIETAAAPAAPASAPAVAADTPPAVPASDAFTPSVRWLLLAWLVGAGVLGVRFAVAAFGLAAWRRRSRAFGDGQAGVLCRKISADYGIKRAVELRVADGCPVPMTWGALCPVVLLPPDAANWPESRLTLVLRHELAHVARHDWLARLFAQVATILHWPNPLVWFAARSARLAQEQACDDLVLAAGVPAEDYALELVATARRLQAGHLAGSAVAMAEPSTLGKRVDGIIAEQRDRRPSEHRTMAVAAVAAVFTLAFCVLAQVRAAEPTKPSAPPPLAVDSRPRVPPVSVVGEKVVSTSVAKLPPPDPADKFPQVEVETRFIQVERGAFDLKELAPYGQSSHDGRPLNRWSGRLDVQSVVRALEAKPGSELLSSPSLAVKPGNRATITIGQELRYPQSYTKTGEATDFISKKIGVELNVTATVTDENHAIKLDVQPRVTEFEGFVEYEGGKFQPVFSVREIASQVWILDGDTLVFGGLTRTRQVAPAAVSAGGAKTITADSLAKSEAGNAEKTELFIFITARIIKAANTPPGGSR